MSTSPCPVDDDVTLCRCNLNASEMIHGTDASLYPKAGCFRVGKILYSAREFYNAFGRHMWEMFIHNPAGVSQRRVYRLGRLGLYSVKLLVRSGTVIAFFSTPTVNGLLPSVHIRRIQLAIRAFLRWKFEQRALAMAMGLHERLGDRTCIGGLPAEIVEKILTI